MLPFEQLRALARYTGDDDAGLVREAAECLADFAADPQLVMVCRRLLAHHPACGPLWWLCARVVAAAAPAAAARACVTLLEGDRSAHRLSSALPFPSDEPIAVLGWADTVAAATAERPDLDVVAVRPRHGDRGLRGRLARSARPVRMVDETEAMALEPSHLLIEVRALSTSQAFVPPGTADLRWALPATRVWLVAGVGRLLPDRLFAVARDEIARGDDPVAECFEVADAERVAGPAGVDPPDRLATRLDCPIAPELHRL